MAVYRAIEGRPSDMRLEAAQGGVLCDNASGVPAGLLRAPDKRAPLPGAASLCQASRFTAELWQAAQLQPRGIDIRKEIEAKQKQSLLID